jgi:biotin transport system substrate-specific component
MNSKSFSLYFNQTVWHSVAAIAFFVTLTALTARITIYLPFTPVPITLQTLAVVLSGLVLGARGGALAQFAYLGLLATGLPLDANGLGIAAFFGPTAGYLVGFVPAAAATGLLAEKFAGASWWGNFTAAITGIVVIYIVGVSWLAVVLGNVQQALVAGILPFVLFDLIKAAIAAVVTESGRYYFSR